MFTLKRINRMVMLTALAVLTSASLAVAPPHPYNVAPELWQTLASGQASDMIIEFKQQADLSAAYQLPWDARGKYVVNALQSVVQTSQAAVIAYLDSQNIKHQSFLAGNQLYVYAKRSNTTTAVAGITAMAALTTVAAMPEVALVRAPITIKLPPSPVTQEAQLQGTTVWGIADVKAPDFWSAFGVKGDGMVVANIDTGVQWNHPALVNQFKCGSNPTDPACWLDPSNVCGAGGACDNNGHGTHTMGTMVASDDPSQSYIAGMAPKAKWIACRGCETNDCSEYAINACADWILAPGGNPANRPNIVNNSWGADVGHDSWYQGKVQAWRAAGIFPAFSAGNSGPNCNTLRSPGDYQESIGSAAYDSSRTIASFSSRGPSAYGDTPYIKPNIAAPGVSILSTVPTDSWGSKSGTSMASPHTAGAVALLWSCDQSLIGDIDKTTQLLQNNADHDALPAGNCGAPPTGQGNYTYGYGYLDVLAAGNHTCAMTFTPKPVTLGLEVTVIGPAVLTTTASISKISGNGISVNVNGTCNIDPPGPSCEEISATQRLCKFSKSDASTHCNAEITATDCLGRTQSRDPVMTTLQLNTGNRATQTFTGIPQAEHFIGISNANPGLSRLEILVNNSYYKALKLTDNQTRTIDVAAAMQPGDSNTLTFAGAGRPGASADILVADTPLADPSTGATQSSKPILLKKGTWGRLANAFEDNSAQQAVLSSQQQVRLQFATALNLAKATNPLVYTVQVNGKPVGVRQVVVTSKSAQETTLILILPDGTLRAGDQVQVSWDRLEDAEKGQPLSGQLRLRAK